MAEPLEFSYRGARSGAITIAITAVIVIESVAVHFAIAARNRPLAWALTLTSVLAIVWLVRDYLALGRGLVRLGDDTVQLMIGRRFNIPISLGDIERALKPSFRDLPTPGTNEGRDYLNLTKPASPNVLIVLAGPQKVHVAAGIHRKVKRIGLKLDDSTAFLIALEQRRATLADRSA